MASPESSTFTSGIAAVAAVADDAVLKAAGSDAVGAFRVARTSH